MRKLWSLVLDVYRKGSWRKIAIAADIAAWAAAEEPASDIRCSCLESPKLCARDTAAPGPRSLGPMPKAPGRPPGIPGIPPGIPGGAPPGN